MLYIVYNMYIHHTLTAIQYQLYNYTSPCGVVVFTGQVNQLGTVHWNIGNCHRFNLSQWTCKEGNVELRLTHLTTSLIPINCKLHFLCSYRIAGNFCEAEIFTMFAIKHQLAKIFRYTVFHNTKCVSTHANVWELIGKPCSCMQFIQKPTYITLRQ